MPTKFADIARAQIKRILPAGIAGIAVTAIIVFIMTMSPPPAFVARIDRGIYDIFLRSMTNGEPSPVPILIDVDERSLAELKQWPWPRYLLAELIAALIDAGVKAVGVDILLAEPDRTSLTSIKGEFAQYFGIDLGIAGAPPDLMDNDEYMASVIKGLPVVLGIQLNDTDEADAGTLRPFPITELRAPDAPRMPDLIDQSAGVIMPIPKLADSAAYHAPINAAGDDDGLFRRIPLFLGHNDEPIPCLALATLALAAGDKGIRVRVLEDGPRSVRVAGVDVPISSNGTMPISFRGVGGIFPTYSACDILRGEIDPSLLAGRIAFFGSTAAGLRDLRPTPFDRNYPGLELHAAAVDTILSKRFIHEPQWVIGLNFILVILLGIACIPLFALAPSGVAFAFLAASIAAVWFGCSFAMSRYGIFISPLYMLCSVTIQAFQTFSLRFFTEERSKRVLRRAFSNYVSPEIVGRIVERGGISSLSGETRNISVLFTDLRGFTSMTEKMSPTDVSSMLGMYFTPMTAIVRSSGGTLDKFVGDALMAFWNAPLDVADHPRAAVASLMKMQDALADLNRDLEPRFGVTLRMGGGIHTGDAHVGNMGTTDLMDYTAIGDTVNTASRLEGMCSKYGVGIVVSSDTAESLRGDERFVLRELDLVRVKGRKTGITISTVYSPEEAARRADELARWGDAFAHYIDGDFASAHEICESLRAEVPNEKLYQIFTERTETMLREPPEHWDGIYTYESK